MRKVSKSILNWFLTAMLIMGLSEVSGKGLEIKPIKLTSKEVGVLPLAPGITPVGPVTFCKGGYLVVTGANNNSTFQWQVGGNNISNSNNDSLFVTNSGTYTCIVTNGGNSTTLNDVVVTIEAILISATSTNICNGSSTTLTASGSTTGTYTWITPPATSGAAITVSPTTNTTYSVWSDINSCRDTASITITVKPKPIASFTYSPNSGCPRKKRKLNFISTSQQNGAGNLSYSWNFGDPNSGSNNTSDDNDPDHSFIGSGFGSSGNYTVTLTVTGNNGCSSTISQNIAIGSFPDASLYDAFNSPEFSICDSNVITVVNASSTIAINTSYQILWGDGQSTVVNTMDSLTHSYLTTGSQNLTFIVSSNGCKDSSEYSVYIGSNPGIGLSTSGSTTLLCLPSTKTFFIDTTRTLNNPLGTVYTVVYNDGSPNQVFSHPPPASFSHTFTTTSCGASGGTFINTFFVEIYASNPCGTTKATVEPITTTKPPEANFIVSPDTIVCVNSNVSFTNNTQSGNVVVQTGTGPSASFACDPSSSPFWSFSALSGVANSWTTTGSLGVLPNNPGAQTISATFSQTGTYLVKLQVRNNATSSASCRSDDTIKVICVQSPPSPYFKTSQKTGCRNLSINFTDSSYNLPTCGVVTRLWTVTKISNICIADSLIDFRYVGTNSISLNPQMIFYNQGDYQIKLTLTNKCGSFSFFDTIKVKRRPEVSINLSPNITCINQSISPTNTSTCFIDANTTYAWTFASGNPSTSNVSSPGTITYASSGSYNIGLTVTNVCGSTPASAAVTVNPLPTVTGTLSVCVGQNTTLTGTSTATGSETWTSDNTGVATVSSSGVVTGVAAGSAIITFTDANGCQKGVTVTVNPLPTITNNAAICVGSTLTLTGSATAATTNPWVSATTSVATVTNAGVVTAVSAGTSVITYTNSNGCKSDVTFTVNPLPTISGDTIVCLNNTSQLTGSATAATTNPWASSSTTVATVTTGGLVTTVSVGTSIITYTNTNGCAKKVTVIVKPLPVITGSSSICVGSNVSFSATTNPATSTPWSSSNTSVATVSNLGAVVGVAAGTSTITYTNEFGCQATFSVTVSSSPTATISYPTTVCTNQTNQNVTLTGATGGTFSLSPVGTTGLSLNTSTGSVNPSTSTAGTYTVNYNIPAGNGCSAVNVSTSITITNTPSGPTVTSPVVYCQNATASALTATATGSNSLLYYTTSTGGTGVTSLIPSTTTAGSTTYYVSQSTANGCEGPRTSITVTVNPLPTITGNSAICVGSTLTLTGSATAATTNPWVSATTSVATVTNAGVVTAVSSGTSVITYTNSNGCKSDVTFTANPLPTITGDTIICLNNTSQLTGSATAATTNPWVSATTSVATVSTGGLVSTVSVGTSIITYTNTNGCVKKVTVIVKPLPVITGSSSICVGSNVSFSATTNPATSTPWSSSNTSVATVSNLGAVVGVAAGTSIITYTNEFGCQATFSVTVSSSPTATISYPSTICTNQTNQNVTLTGATGGTFSLSPVGTTGLSLNTSTGSVNPSTSTAGTYTVNYNIPAGNGCPAVNIDTTITITNTPSAPVPSGNNICSGNTLQLNTSYTGSGTPTWNWTGPNGFSSSDEDPSISNATVAATGTYNVTVTISGCISPAGTVNLVVNQTPATPNASSNTPVCTGNALTLNASTTSTMPVTWSWSGPNSFTSNTQNPQVSANATTAMDGTYDVIAIATYTATALSCSSAIASTIVVVNPTPVISSSSSTNPSDCASSTGSITLNGLNASTSYTVHYTNSAGAQTSTLTSSSSGVITISSLPAGTYSNVYVVLTNCPSTSVGPFSLVDPTPPATPVIQSVNPLCSGNTINLSASTTSSGTATWSWTGPNSFTSSDQNPTITNATTLATGVYSVTVTINSCTSPAGTINVTVNQTPATPTASSNTPVCTGNALTLNASTTSTMPVTWSWSGPNGFTSTTQNPQVSANATTAMAGTYEVYATATYTTSTTLNCPSATASTIVVVNPTPAISSSSSTNPSECASSTGSITLNGLNASTSYTVHYTNSAGAQTSTITSNSSGVITIPLLPAGTYSNVYVVLTNCPSTSVGPFSLVDPTPPPVPTATNNGAICDGELLQLNATTTATGNATWNWTGPNGFTNTSYNPSINPAGLNANGVYSVTVTISNCTSLAGTTTVIVNPRPLSPVAPSPVYCQFDVPVALTATALPGHTLNWYTSSTGGTGSLIAPIPSTSTVGTVSYYVSQTTPEICEGLRTQIDVIVNPTPVVSGQSQTICSGASFLISPSGTSSVPSNTLYSWGLPVVTGGLTGGAIGANQSNITGTLSNPTDSVQTATYIVTPISGNCPGDTFIVVISVNPAPRIVFSLPNQSICSGDISQAVTLTSPTPGAVIPWTSIQPVGINGVTLSGSGTIPAQTLINTTPNPITVTYTAIASTTGASACPGTPSLYQIVVTPTPVIPNTTETICSGGFFNVQPVNNSNTIVPSGTTYTWTVSSNSNITGQTDQPLPQTSIADTLTNITNVPQTIVYTAEPRSGIADSCFGQQFTITVTVNPKPVIPTLTQTVCSEIGFLLNPINAQPNSNTIVPNATVYNWSAPTLPVGMSGAASGTNETTINGTLFNTTFAPITITYVVTPTSGAAGSCPGLPFNVEITVNPLASISNNPLSQSVCNGNTTTSVNWSSFTANASYSWTLVSFGNITGYLSAGNGPTLGTMTLSNTGIAQDSVVYAVSSTASACAGPASNYTIYVNPDANAIYTYPYDTACWPYSLVINNTSLLSPGNINIPNSSYNWYNINQLGTESFIGTGSVFPGYIIPGPSDSIKIKMVAISAFGCKNDSLTHTFFTKPKPTALFAMSNRDSCGPLTISFVNQTNIRDTFRYQWNFGNGQTSTATNPAPVTYLSNPRFYDTTYYITLKAFNECDTSTFKDSVIVRADPKARFSVSSSSGCSPFTIQVTNSSLGNPHTYYWDFGDGTPIQTTTTLGTLSHTYYTGIVDTFDLMLIAESNCGRDTQIINIRVAPNVIVPGISVNATELFGCVSHSVNFINTSTGATNFTWNFGDGTPLQTTNFFQTIVNHTYNTAGNFNVQINMTNGCSDTSINTSITVYPRPTAAFTTNQTVYCLGDTSRFINNSTNATNYVWSFGNGVFNTNFQPNYVYLNPGVYNIQLQAQQSNATGLVCFDTITRSITILNKPDTAITTNIRSANCIPYLMTASVPGYTTESITWYVYDTTLPVYPVVISNPVLNYTFNNSGRFKVVMVIENASGCKDSSFRFLSVYAKPVAAFTPLNLVTCSLDTLVSYTNNTTANIYTPLTYRWFVDGIQRATSGNFTYRYTALPTDILPRIFDTKLVATNSVGCADSVTGRLQINPTAKSIFTLINPQACIPFVAAINNSSTYASSYQWYLNGVLVSTDENPIINITTANTSYTVTLIVSNIYACRPDTSSYTFRSRVMPIAAFSFNDTLGCNGQLAVVTTNNSQFANSYIWQWGDASPNSTLFNPSHLFTSVGSFNTTLTASDGVCTDTVSHAVVVSQKPTANFIANNVKNCDTAGVRFINLTANATSFLWTVSNGFTTTETSPTITFNPSTTAYTVTLLALNAAGCRDSITRANYIKVYAMPQADFTITPSSTIYIPNYTFGFLNLTPDYPIYKYNWSLGDGSYAITRDVVSHLYNDTGNYEVRLTVLDTTTSCVDTVIKYARIIGYPGYLYVPNAFYANSTQIDFKYFKPIGKGLAEYELLIFDSWGKLLFRTNKLDYAGSPVEGWDGTYKGAPMPQDAYAWKIKARFRNGKVWEGMNYDKSQQGQPAHSFGTLTLFR